MATEQRQPGDPRILGRFNFLQYKKDLYNILFVPYIGGACIMIAKNLPYEEMDFLLKALNNELDITSDHIKQILEEGGVTDL